MTPFFTFRTEGTAFSPLSYSSTKNFNGSILERWEDQHGRLIQSRDPSGQITVFNHDHEGRIVNVTLGGTLLLTNTFDILGNKTSVWEANSGTSSSTYNALGEVMTSTNAKSQETSYNRDVYGRPQTVTKPGSEGAYTTTYFESGPALGSPKKTTSPNGYVEEITAVDDFGRPLSTSKTFGGETFTTATTYDALGRVLTETDAGGLTVVHEYDAKYSFPVKLSIAPGCVGGGKILWKAGTFDSKGRATSQTLAQGVTTSATYDDVEDDDSVAPTGLLRSLNASAGDTTLQSKSYKWTKLGNLNSRIDDVKHVKEVFGYDGLNRVTSATASTLAGGPTTVAPVANFGYDTKGNLSSKAGESRSYPTSGNRPHAVSAATIKGAAHTYEYDTAGYMTFDKDAGTGNTRRSYTWTSFGQLLSLDYLTAPALQDLGGTQIYAPSRVETGFTFDAGGNRLTQTKERKAVDLSAKLELTTYLGAYEKEVHRSKAAASGSSFNTDRTVHRHNIGGFAVYTTTEVVATGAVTAKLTTLLKDHLGSTDVLYTSTWNGYDFANPVTERQSFDSWGERRSPDTLVSYRAADGDAFRTSGQDYDRGYTGHEQLDDSGLIHMNGRIYDPELGRMLSPDPFVQVPEYSQNFNRYSYVMNNPLNLTDPTGFSWLGEAFHDVGGWLKENWRTVVVIVVAIVLTVATAGIATAAAAAVYGATSSVALASAAAYVAWGGVVGALTGGLSSALAGGDLADVLRGAVVGGISGALTGALHMTSGLVNIVGHGVVGGASNVAMGGKFQDGFLSAAAAAATAVSGLTDPRTSNFNMAGRTAIASIAGGTASALGGGKFGNGAVTGAMAHLLNAEFTRKFDVNAVFDKKKSSLTAWVIKDDKFTRYELTVDSGGAYSDQQFVSNGTDVPNGDYYIVPDPNPTGKARSADSIWFGLYRIDGKIDDYDANPMLTGPGAKRLIGKDITFFGRGNYRLHLGTFSTGCVTCYTGNLAASKVYVTMANAIAATPLVSVPIYQNGNGRIGVYGTLQVK